MVSDLKTFTQKGCKIAALKKVFFGNFVLLSRVFWYWCYYLHRSRDSLSPVSRIFTHFKAKISKSKTIFFALIFPREFKIIKKWTSNLCKRGQKVVKTGWTKGDRQTDIGIISEFTILSVLLFDEISLWQDIISSPHTNLFKGKRKKENKLLLS